MWRFLQQKGVSTHAELLDDPNGKRSALVVALLAQFTDVVVRSPQPIVIEPIDHAQS